MANRCKLRSGSRNWNALQAFLLCAFSLVGATSAPVSDPAVAIAAVTPRKNPPPAETDPLRPEKTRLLKPSVWTDDVGVDDAGNLYNQYKRSSFGTWSNYDEAKANPYPIPDPLTLKDGQRVKDADTWWQRRRPEIFHDFSTEIYGQVPERTPKITWEVTSVTQNAGSKTKTIVGHIDNSAYPEAKPVINLTLTLPANSTGPVPVMVVVAAGGGGAPRRPAGTAAAPVGEATPPAKAPASPNPSSPGRPSGPSPMEQLLARGWGYASFNTGSVQADSAAGLSGGIIGLVNRGQPAADPADWGVLTAWVWGLSRAIDYFETDPEVDAKQLGVEGHSRWGKTALWAAASDPRWAIVYASCSGEGGAKLFRRNFGETTDNIAGSHWMAGNFRKYGGHWNDLPVDANALIALVAPRPVFITGATQDPWSDPHGEFLAAVGAGPVYRLLGKKDLGTTEMPAPNVTLGSGEIAFREHIGAHTDLPDWPEFLVFASKYIRTPPASKP